MPTERERSYARLAVAGLMLAGSLMIVLVAEFLPVSAGFYWTSQFFFAATIATVMITVMLDLLLSARAAWRAGHATAHMFAVGERDRVLENRAVGESLVRTAVAGLEVPITSLTPDGHAPARVQRLPEHHLHWTRPLPSVQELPGDLEQEFLTLMRSNGKEGAP